MYFLTLPDPNYVVKGSRDPLGFQVLWQKAGRLLIPDLSTVSSSIKDFQIMAFANFCRKECKIRDEDYLPFFLCFEQAMGYARFKESDGYDSFNGVDKVRKVMTSSGKELSLSVSGKDQLLSNQKSYGIWGKYNRPFSDIGIGTDSKFISAQQRKYHQNPQLKDLVERLQKKRGSVHIISKDSIGDFRPFFRKPEGTERKCYQQYLLADESRGELLRLTGDNPGIAGMRLYEQLAYLKAHSRDDNFRRQVELLANTERVLSPLNRIFRRLQGRSWWTYEEIDGDELISEWSKAAPLTAQGAVSPELAGLLLAGNRDLVAGLAAVNGQVCKRRGSEPWINLTPTGVEINHFDGAFSDPDYDPRIHNDYSYFLQTWFSIYKQLN